MRTTPPYRLVISIINFRTGDLTLACVKSVLADLGDVDGHCVIIDNASGDGSAEQIETWIAEQTDGESVTLLRSQTNSGFSGGHNQGMAACPADYYLLLNSDAILRPGFVSALLHAGDTTPEAGFLAPRLEGDDGIAQNSFFRFATPSSELMRAAQTAPVDRLLKSRVIALGPEPEAAHVEWASFACIALNGRMVHALGPMDEGYFLYFEDAEYCLRARRAGWHIALALDAVAVHYRGGSGPVKSLEKTRKRMPRYFYASRTRFLYQAHGHSGLLMANLMWHLGRVFAQLRRLFGKPVPASISHEAQDIWTNAFHPKGPSYAPDE